jgi:O-antigen ligase
MFIISVILIIGFLFYINLTSNRYSQGFGEERSATGRLYLWQAGAMIALDNPVIGIGEGKFKEYSEFYSQQVEQKKVVSIESVLGIEEAHNDFIRVWVSFGTPALLAYLWVFFATFANFIHAYRQSNSLFLKGMAVGGFAALMAYIVNSFTHNLMESVPILWILAGLSAACVKLGEVKKPVAVVKGATGMAPVNPLLDSPPPGINS